MKAAVVILNWNGKEHLKKYLPYVVQFTDLQVHELIVADNGSTDESVTFLNTNFPQIRLIEMDHNYGFAEGYNRALSQIDADIYCILNSDVRATKNWIEPVLKLFERDPSIAAIQPKILSDRDWSRFEHAGAAGGFIDKYGYPFCRGRIMDAIEYDKGQYNVRSEIFWASGACLFIRADVFNENGGFDADYFAHMEEIDLCWRLKNRGYRIAYCPKSRVYHYGGATLEYNNPKKLFLNFRNSLWTLYKNYQGNHLNFIMFKRMLIDTAAIFKFAFTFDLKNAAAVIKAHMAYYASKPNLKAKRNLLNQHVSHKTHTEIFTESIVLHFFLKQEKTFNELKKFKSAIIQKAKSF